MSRTHRHIWIWAKNWTCDSHDPVHNIRKDGRCEFCCRNRWLNGYDKKPSSPLRFYNNYVSNYWERIDIASPKIRRRIKKWHSKMHRNYMKNLIRNEINDL